jgi:hypothetical protein
VAEQRGGILHRVRGEGDLVEVRPGRVETAGEVELGHRGGAQLAQQGLLGPAAQPQQQERVARERRARRRVDRRDVTAPVGPFAAGAASLELVR